MLSSLFSFLLKKGISITKGPPTSLCLVTLLTLVTKACQSHKQHAYITALTSDCYHCAPCGHKAYQCHKGPTYTTVLTSDCCHLLPLVTKVYHKRSTYITVLTSVMKGFSFPCRVSLFPFHAEITPLSRGCAYPLECATQIHQVVC